MSDSTNIESSINIPVNGAHLNGLLNIPKTALGLVIFVHGSGSSRLSIRNQHVARILNDANLATLLFDLFTPEEEAIDTVTSEIRFNIDFLARRLIEVTRWCINNPDTHHLTIGYFGASTGASAALVAATQKFYNINAIVSRGGRPDLAGELLTQVKAPTLLIVGENDDIVITLNTIALSRMTCIKELKIIPKATHLFEEPGTLDQVAHLAKEWFIKFL